MKVYLKQSSATNGVTLTSLGDVSLAFTKVTRHSYRTIFRIKGLRTPELSLQIGNVSNGSIVLDLVAEILTDKNPGQMVFGALAHANNLELQNILDHAKAALEFWRIFADKKKKEGHSPVVHLDNSNSRENVNIIIQNSGTMTVSPESLRTAIASRTAGADLVRPILRGELENVSLGFQENNPVSFDFKNADSFETSADTDESIVDYIGEIVEFNKQSRKGRFIDHATGTRYHFEASDTLIDKTILSMRKRECKIRGFSTYIPLPDNKRKVISLILSNVEQGSS